MRDDSERDIEEPSANGFAPEDRLARTDPELDRSLREAFVTRFLRDAGLGEELRSRIASMFLIARGRPDLVPLPGGAEEELWDLTCHFAATGTTNYYYGDIADTEQLDAWIDGAVVAAVDNYLNELSRGWTPVWE